MGRLHPGPHRLLGHHLVDGDVLADVAQELEHADRLGPVGVVDQRGRSSGPGAKSRRRSSWTLMAATLARSVSRSSRLRSSDCGRSGRRPCPWPRRPAGTGRWPASWNRRSAELAEQVADVEAVGGGVEADVDADRPVGQALGQRVEVGGVVDQPTRLQVVDQVHGGGHGAIRRIPMFRRGPTPSGVSRGGTVGVAGDVPPPRVLDALRQPDAGADTPDRPAAGCRRRRSRARPALGRTTSAPSRRRSMPKRLAQPGRAPSTGRGRDRGRRRAARISSSPAIGAPARRSTAWPSVGRAGDHVGAPVHPVGEVDVEVAGRPEHRGVAARRPPEGVAGRVLGAGVGLDLHDPAAARADAPAPCRAAQGRRPGCPGRRTPAARVPSRAPSARPSARRLAERVRAPSRAPAWRSARPAPCSRTRASRVNTGCSPTEPWTPTSNELPAPPRDGDVELEQVAHGGPATCHSTSPASP